VTSVIHLFIQVCIAGGGEGAGQGDASRPEQLQRTRASDIHDGVHLCMEHVHSMYANFVCICIHCTLTLLDERYRCV